MMLILSVDPLMLILFVDGEKARGYLPVPGATVLGDTPAARARATLYALEALGIDPGEVQVYAPRESLDAYMHVYGRAEPLPEPRMNVYDALDAIVGRLAERDWGAPPIVVDAAEPQHLVSTLAVIAEHGPRYTVLAMSVDALRYLHASSDERILKPEHIAARVIPPILLTR